MIKYSPNLNNILISIHRRKIWTKTNINIKKEIAKIHKIIKRDKNIGDWIYKVKNNRNIQISLKIMVDTLKIVSKGELIIKIGHLII